MLEDQMTSKEVLSALKSIRKDIKEAEKSLLFLNCETLTNSQYQQLFEELFNVFMNTNKLMWQIESNIDFFNDED